MPSSCVSVAKLGDGKEREDSRPQGPSSTMVKQPEETRDLSLPTLFHFGDNDRDNESLMYA